MSMGSRTRKRGHWRVGSLDDLQAIRGQLRRSAERTRTRLLAISGDESFLEHLKFEELGCDPLDEERPLNIIEQINQQATYEVAADAIEDLMRRSPGHQWEANAGASGEGPDIWSEDREIEAEIFAVVSPTNNKKLEEDVDRMRGREAQGRYVFYRSASGEPSEEERDGVTVIRLGRHP